MSDLNVIHAAHLAQVSDSGTPRRGRNQGELDLIADGAIAIRSGRIVAVGRTADVLSTWGDPAIPTVDASGKTVLPGLVECHSHPIFHGERHAEYAERLGGASLADVAARGGGIWSSVEASRRATSGELLKRLGHAYERIIKGGVTTLEVKSGYGLTTDQELRELELLNKSRMFTTMDVVITFLGAHVVPRDIGGDDPGARYTDLVEHDMLPAAAEQGYADFHDVTVEDGLFTPDQALRLMRASERCGLPVRVHADAWKPSRGLGNCGRRTCGVGRTPHVHERRRDS